MTSNNNWIAYLMMAIYTALILKNLWTWVFDAFLRIGIWKYNTGRETKGIHISQRCKNPQIQGIILHLLQTNSYFLDYNAYRQMKMHFVLNFIQQADLTRPFPTWNISVSTDCFFQGEDTIFQLCHNHFLLLTEIIVTQSLTTKSPLYKVW